MHAEIDARSRENIQREIDAIAWYHEFDFGNGLVATSKTSNVASHRRLWQFIEPELDRIDFRGKTVLDVGCWDGYWSFYAERRGASQVLATDDRSQNRTGHNGLHLAKRLLRSKIEVDTDVSIYELTKLGRTFDVILCPGVYYHLLDPFYAFAQVRHCCHPDSVIVFEGDAVFTDPRPDPRPVAYFSDHASKGPRFVPEIQALRQMLRATYFTIEHEAVHFLAAEATGTHRILLICRTLTGENDFHVYRPPFGLHPYDQRWP
jgi:tRNA (mo5U34)-methyltransferase